jgi:hypothetical protein
MLRSPASFALISLLVACSQPDQPRKGSPQQGSDAAASGTTAGSISRSHRSTADDTGNIYEGVVCDASTEGIAWCDDDFDIVFCSDQTWWLLDCTAIGADYCGDDGLTVDCYVW